MTSGGWQFYLLFWAACLTGPGQRLVSEPLWLQGEDAAMKHISRCYRIWKRQKQQVAEDKVGAMQDIGKRHGEDFVQAHPFLKELPGCQWLGWPAAFPTLSMVFRADLLPAVAAPIQPKILEQQWQKAHEGIESRSWTESRDPGPAAKHASLGAFVCAEVEVECAVQCTSGCALK